MNDFRPSPQDWYDRATIARTVANEQYLQDQKWGQQNHATGTGPNHRPLAEIIGDLTPAHQLAKMATDATDRNAAIGCVTWRDILLEEVFEAMAEDDPDSLETELIQVAAVAQQFAACVRRKKRHLTPVVVPNQGETSEK